MRAGGGRAEKRSTAKKRPKKTPDCLKASGVFSRIFFQDSDPLCAGRISFFEADSESSEPHSLKEAKNSSVAILNFSMSGI